MRLHCLPILALCALVRAHGAFEHETLERKVARREYNQLARRSLEECAGNLLTDGTTKRVKERRHDFLNEHRRHKKRSLSRILGTSHENNGTWLDPNRHEDVFGAEYHVLLNPYGDNGPYYVPGEIVRYDAIDGELGIPLIMEAQFIDFITCKPVPGIWWDMWNANATGVYSGVINEGNGNFLDHSNVNRTFGRAIQMADQDGVARIKTIFPGHYTGRTNHIHIIAHTNVIVLPNGTITGGSIPHIGQFFFDQALIDEVEQTYPYSDNTYSYTGNALDDTFRQESAYSNSDPVFHWEYLGDRVEDGLFVWIQVGINSTANWNDEYSFVWSDKGGNYSCGTGRIGKNYTTSDEDCADNVNVGELPGESGPGPVVYSAPPPSASDNATEEAEKSADLAALQSQVAYAESTEAVILASISRASVAAEASAKTSLGSN
ncbi:hypothetical protein SCUCBS95973_002916 [Sporothrix curviconia]|uniref:Intradiol ring-cleavage dioxygenases domain-containing protein n=1 Tax=Sporothrix curviconia TaxID=1260050 RepID=A0ABP0BAW4_9PEZI